MRFLRAGDKKLSKKVLPSDLEHDILPNTINQLPFDSCDICEWYGF
jgi:hypothetical protein